jgi:endonuclease/exonuclease/phosphatase (EEP) superfamily protein YafD
VTKKSIQKFNILLLFYLLLSLSGCVHIPEHLGIEGSDGDYIATQNTPSCLVVLPDRRENTRLDPEGFRLMNWNIYKTRKKEWEKDLESLSRDYDILTLQEGYAIKKLQFFFDRNDYYWNIATAFTYDNVTAGVLTAAKVKPDLLCFYREFEPLLRIPKTSLITRYTLKSSNKKLLVANLHMVNYSLGHEAFHAQLESLARVLESHDGPLILSGDLNTWSAKRQSIINKFCRRFDLQEVIFPLDKVTRRFGNPLDHIYFRGLVPTQAKIVSVDSSDHNPQFVTFKLAE